MESTCNSAEKIIQVSLICMILSTGAKADEKAETLVRDVSGLAQVKTIATRKLVNFRKPRAFALTC